MRVKTIGIVLETREDALRSDVGRTDDLYHWREPEEVESIVKAIESLGFTVRILGTPQHICSHADLIRREVDFILNLSVGFRSRFRLALGPALYELAGIPYSGADPYTKMASQNKHLLKSFLEKLNIPTPAWTYVDDPAAVRALSFPEFPLIVKPAFEGSSIGIHEQSVVGSEQELEKRVLAVMRDLNMPVLVERFIVGREYKVGYIGNGEKKFRGIIEDVRADGSPLADRFLFFRAKKDGAFAKARRDIGSGEVSALIRDCDRIYDLLLPLDYATFDVRMDEHGRHYFLECNADATLHPRRTLARCCALNGVAFDRMIELILMTAFERRGLL